MPEATADIDLAWAAAAALESEAPGPEQAYYRQVGQIWAGAAITRAGLLDSARNVLDRARADRRDDPQGQLAFQEAFARLLLGERDEALDLLSEYVASNPALEHDPSSAVHWWWFDLRDDPRFMRMMRADH